MRRGKFKLSSHTTAAGAGFWSSCSLKAWASTGVCAYKLWEETLDHELLLKRLQHQEEKKKKEKQNGKFLFSRSLKKITGRRDNTKYKRLLRLSSSPRRNTKQNKNSLLQPSLQYLSKIIYSIISDRKKKKNFKVRRSDRLSTE